MFIYKICTHIIIHETWNIVFIYVKYAPICLYMKHRKFYFHKQQYATLYSYRKYKKFIFICGNMPYELPHVKYGGNSIFPYEICHHIFIQEIYKIPYFIKGNLPLISIWEIYNIPYFIDANLPRYFHMRNKENIKNKAIFSNMNLQLLILSEERQKAKTSAVWCHLCVEPRI